MVRPETFSQFIGQRNAVEQIQLALQSATQRNDVIDHVLLSGPAGTGKTTIAKIIANTVGTRCVEVIAKVIKSPADAITNLVNLRRGDVLFIDEIHALPVSVQEYFYTAMEDYSISTISSRTRRAATINLHKFVLVGATTNEGMLTGPMLSRFGITCQLEPYNQLNLVQIVMNAAAAQGMQVDGAAAQMVADRCRNTPRIALRQLRRIRDSATMQGDPNHISLEAAKHAYGVLGISKYGLTKNDIKVLRILSESDYAIGVESLVSLANIDSDTITQTIEPHLMRLGFIIRTPRGRVITNRGRAVI